MASNSDGKFQIVYAAPTNLCKQTNWPCKISYGTGVSPTATLSHWGQASSRKQSECGRHALSNILKLQATFLYSMYHQWAGKTNLFHMRQVEFTLGIRYIPLNYYAYWMVKWEILWGQGHQSPTEHKGVALTECVSVYMFICKISRKFMKGRNICVLYNRYSA